MNTHVKTTALCNNKTDVIFLSDTRLGDKGYRLEHLFRMQYKMISNSSMSKRGVCILIKNNINMTIGEEFRDVNENILLIKATCGDNTFIIGSVYGPNTDDKKFFDDLRAGLRRLGDLPIILGGDWNATPSCDAADSNLDVLNMATIPSVNRSTWLNEIITGHGLTDIYRYLNPDTRDYTYQPHGLVRRNRSCIDFFLISQVLVDSVKSTSISDRLCKKTFDHRTIFLNLGKQKRRGRPITNNRIVLHPLFLIVATLAVYETYIKNIIRSRNGIREMLVIGLCEQLEVIDNSLYNLQQQCDSWDWKPVSPEAKAARDLEFNELLNTISGLIGLDELATYPRKVDDDFFFEDLIIITNKRILRLQHDSAAAECLMRKQWSEDLKNLKLDFQENLESIILIENNLSLSLENEIRDKVDNYIKHDIVNSERMTPTFLCMAKTVNNDSIDNICDNNEVPFVNSKLRAEHITNFYSNLYKVPADAPDDFTGCIERFLGPEICSNQSVSSMKLGEEESRRLDRPLSIEELDRALELANKKSAPGIDGVSNKVICKIWHLVRIPLLNYANCCFRKGRLTDTFRTACIRIIPKKGNTKLLKKLETNITLIMLL